MIFDVNAALNDGVSPDAIVSHLASQKDVASQLGGFDINQAIKDGISNQDIISHLSQQESNDTYTAALESGAHNAISNLGAGISGIGTAANRIFGNTVAGNAIQGAGNFLQTGASAIPNNFSGQPLSDAGDDIENDHPLDALSDLAKGGAEALPGLAAGAAATYVDPLLGAAEFGTSGAGDTLQSRMAAENETTPSNADLLAAGGNGLVQGATSLIGLNALPAAIAGKLAPAVLQRLLRAGGGDIAGDTAQQAAKASTAGLSRIPANMVLAAGAGAIGNTAQQVSDTAGTPGGLSISPTDVATSAITGALARGALDLPGALKGSIANIQAKGKDQANAASILRVNQMLDQAKTQAQANDATPNNTQLINSVLFPLKAKVATLVSNLVENDEIDKQQVNSIFKPLMNQATSHKSVVTDFSGIDSLGLPDATTNLLKNSFLDLQNLNQSKLYKNTTGPFQRFLGNKAADAAGGAIAGGVGLHSLGIPGAGEYAGAMVGRALSTPLSSVGRGIDNAFGLGVPPAIANRLMAQRTLVTNKNPVPTGMSTLDQLDEAINSTTQPSAPTPSANTAPPPTPTDKGNLAGAKVAAGKLASLGPDDQIGSQALDTLISNGHADLAEQALAKWNYLADMRNTANNVAANQQAISNQTAQDRINSQMAASRARQQKQSDLNAALGNTARATSKIDTQTQNNQTTLDANQMMPQVPNASLTAINAAVNQVNRQANNIRAAGGEIVDDDTPQGSPQGSPQAPAPSATASAPSPMPSALPATGGVIPPRTWSDWLADQAGLNGTANLSKADIIASLANNPELNDAQKAFFANNDKPLSLGEAGPQLASILKYAAASKNGSTPDSVVLPPSLAGASSTMIKNPLAYRGQIEAVNADMNRLSADFPEYGTFFQQARVAKTKAEKAAIKEELMNYAVSKGYDLAGAIEATSGPLFKVGGK